jgi:uncharacterized surface protein with fasciclin (FAS1) repeats
LKKRNNPFCLYFAWFHKSNHWKRNCVFIIIIMRVLSALLPSLILISSFTSGQTQTISDIVAADATLSTFANYMKAAGFVTGGYYDVFTDYNSTLFAPTNDAFAVLDQDLLGNYLDPAWILHLRYVLLNHIVDGQIFAANITDGLMVEPLLSEFYDAGLNPLSFTVDDAGVFVSGLAFNDSMVVEADILATDGVIHKVDQVFVPDVLYLTIYDLLVVSEVFTTLLGFLNSTGLASTVQTETLTLFAPHDQVLGVLPAGALDGYNITEVLLNHVVIGDPIPSDFFNITGSYDFTTAAGNTYTVTAGTDFTYFIGEIELIFYDVPLYNGIVHMIDGVLWPPAAPSSNVTEPPGMVNRTKPPDMVSSDPPGMITETEPPGMVSSDPPADSPVLSPVASSAALSSSVPAVFMLLASFGLMPL